MLRKIRVVLAPISLLTVSLVFTTGRSLEAQAFLLPWGQDKNPQYYTGGPHASCTQGIICGLSTVRSAIDFGRGDYQVLSIEAGQVEWAGLVNDRSTANPKSSGSWGGNVVVITHDDGTQSEYWHLDSIEPTLIVGSRIPRGYPIGRPGCTGDGAKKPFGDKTGTCVNHLHIDFRHGGTRSPDNNWNRGTPVPVVSIVLDGWSIQAGTTGGPDGQGSYQGTMTKDGEETRTADTAHCSPSANCIRNNVVIRNDLDSTNSRSASGNPVDVFLLVDLSISFNNDLPVFKAQAPTIISALRALMPNTRFGLGKYEDYPIPPFGNTGSGDKAYERLVDLTDSTDLVLTTINGLVTRSGGDKPESQLVALYQAATGAGQDLAGDGFPAANIPSDQQANFRDGAAKLFLLWTDAPFHQPEDSGTIPYPGPSFDETVAAIKALDPPTPKVIGISSGGGGDADLKAIAIATDALAPTATEAFAFTGTTTLALASGIDCNRDGIVDILPGEPLVCSIGDSGEGLAEAMIALIGAAAEPQPPPPSCQNPASALPDTSVTASSFQAPNVPENTRDGNLGTRWSAEGNGQWIQYDLGTPTTLGQVFIAWYQGNTRTAQFDIEVSMDAATWSPAFSGSSSGITVGREVYDFPDVTARFVRTVGFGNSASAWNSITEVDIYSADIDPNAFLPVASLRASDFQNPNAPENTLDNDFSTRWSAEGNGQWIEYDLGTETAFNQVLIAWYRGDLRQAAFDIEISPDALDWTPVFSGNSSGTTPGWQAYDFPEVTAQFVRIVGRRNTENDWGSLTEVRIRSCRN